MSRHWKSHCSDVYSREQYKIDILSSNGRGKPPICPKCHQPTVIPKGEKDYPHHHKKCYTSSMIGNSNPNYKNGKEITTCDACEKTIIKHASQLNGSKNFCSIFCSMNFYALPENG